MLGIRLPVRKKSSDEGEKPFWISFSDLMSALMVLFMVAMTVVLLAVTQEISKEEKEKAQREEEIDTLMGKIREATQDFPGISVSGRVVDFGDRARFDTNSHHLSVDQSLLLREVVLKILQVARDPLGQKWLKRVVVEGFADRRGTYLHNLNLSLQRSERVMCVLLAPETNDALLHDADMRLVRELFMMGGSSFNGFKDSLDESRRIELRLEFLDIGEQRPSTRDLPLDEKPRCPLN